MYKSLESKIKFCQFFVTPKDNREQISVAVGNKVMDTRLPLPVGSGDKYDISCFDFKHLLNTICKLFKYPSPDTNVSTSHSQGEVSYGRSMIEMLGVLAIIGVLSVGGIAGYSKAMEKFKVNKLMAEYNHLILGLLEYKDNFQKYTKGEPQLTDFVQSVGLVPDSWHMINKYYYLEDSHGNWVDIRYRQKNNPREDAEPEQYGLIIDFYLNVNVDDKGNRTSENFQDKVCMEMVDSIFKPLHYTLKGLILIGGAGMYYGDEFCGSERRCLKNQTISQIKNMCVSCIRTNVCAVTVIF